MITLHQWKERSKVKILDEKGLTLVEVLAVLAITAIVLPVIYGVFHTGINLYNKIQVEGQLRDDADYAVSMMMNSFNSIPFDYATTDDGRIDLVDAEQTAITENTKDNSTFYTYSKEEIDPKNINTRSIEFVENTVDGKEIQSVSIDGNIMEGNGDYSASSLKLRCSDTDRNDRSKCLHGIIEVNFTIHNARIERPLTLESRFGF
ncbi:PilW family protein [Niallia taxi]|uniref:PilW family protein n=1 Tax=Niallia taxi TaxID=2499688 RepID=UPI00300B3CAC